jgi:glucose-6-phosphate 1-dehydrogenase
MSVTSRSAGAGAAPPCTLVVFGAGGDLTRRLLMPALYNLARAGLLDPAFRVIGVGRRPLSDGAWREALGHDLEALAADPAAEFHAERIDAAGWGWLRDRLSFLQGDFTTPALFAELAQRLSGNVVFYLAIPAAGFGPVVDRLGAAGLLSEPPGGFRRVVVEKPFGSDLGSAQALNRRILAVVPERQVFRIDHFLGKGSVQAIAALRSGNRVFDALLHRDQVDHVEITAAETIGVEGRGAFYEATGALRDMVPNHLFQLLAMVAMEPSAAPGPAAALDARLALLRAVQPAVPADAVRGQYAGYRQEEAVAADSRTETYAALMLAVATPRWAGVPFFLRTGKRLGRRRTEIAVRFRAPPAGRDVSTLLFEVDPAHGVDAAGSEVGYEALLLGCMQGDASLFQRGDLVEAGWAVVEPLLAAWAEGAPEPYAAGSDGPAAAEALLARSGRRWRALGAA